MEEDHMNIRLVPINDDNKDVVLALSVREDQPFVAPNDVSLRQADEANAEQPGMARPFAIYANEKLVGFCMFVFNPEEEDEDDRYWIWRFMIDRNEQGKGYGQVSPCRAPWHWPHLPRLMNNRSGRRRADPPSRKEPEQLPDYYH